MSDATLSRTVPGQLPPITPLQRQRFGWRQILSMAISAGLCIAILWKLDVDGLRQALSMVPVHPGFWLIFAAFYFALPFFDWIIFRKFWGLGFSAFPVIVQKRVSNEVLLNYSGELYFYLWAKEKQQFTTAPFAVIKDVNVTSALANNLVTLAMLALLWPFIGSIDPSFRSPAFFISAAAMVLISCALILMRKWVFSLGRKALAFMMQVHLTRILVSTFLLALLWHLALPNVPLLWWFALSAAKLLISRLPFVPNVELMFVTLAVFLVSDHEQIGQLMVMIAALISVSHMLMFVAAFLWRMLPLTSVPSVNRRF